MSRLLTTDEQIAKVNTLTGLANKSEKSSSMVEKIGAFVIYSGLVEFCLIQSARLVEQIILKGQLRQGKTPTFTPHEDEYFFKMQVRPRKIISEIKKLLPLKAIKPEDVDTAEIITRLARKFLESASSFLTYRNRLFHHLCSPTETLESVTSVLDQTLKKYPVVMEFHKSFFDAAQPYRFSPKEIEYFYGKEIS